ncbi:MAG: hypothetical protein WA709_29190 [Stellaceae bacterium]
MVIDYFRHVETSLLRGRTAMRLVTQHFLAFVIRHYLAKIRRY